MNQSFVGVALSYAPILGALMGILLGLAIFLGFVTELIILTVLGSAGAFLGWLLRSLVLEPDRLEGVLESLRGLNR